jgi:diaminopimelate decarboxylase
MIRPLTRRSKQALKTALSTLAQHRNARRRPLPPRLWDLEVDAAGHLTLEGHALAELTARWGSPLHVVHAAALRRNARAFLDDEGGPPCEVYYSYKTNPIPGVLRLLHAEGIGAEVISEYELWLALRLGVDPARIVFNGPVKSDASLREAIGRGIALLNANHREELTRIGAVAAELGRRPITGVRVCTSASWGGQFGAPIDGGEALAAIEEACRNPHLDMRALHVHFGAPLRTEEQLRQLLDETLDLAHVAAERFGFELDILDLGGSLAIPTVQALSSKDKRLNMTFLADLPPPDPGRTLEIRAYVRLVRRLVRAGCQRRGLPVPRIVLEPGRALTGNTQLLLTTVHTLKHASNAAPYAILDAGINLAQSVQSEFHQVYAATKMHASNYGSYRLAGPICSPGDVLYWGCTLPELAPGDTLAIMDAGAYFVPFATSFSFPQPAIVLVDDGAVRPLRRAERFEDLVLCDDP